MIESQLQAHCNSCGAPDEFYPAPDTLKKEYIKDLKSRGWVVKSSTNHYCPSCAERGRTNLDIFRD